MRWPWLWRSQLRQPPCEDRSWQALEDSQLVLETARLRWHRVDEAGRRAAQANEKVRSQREQNHLAEIVRAALLGGKHS